MPTVTISSASTVSISSASASTVSISSASSVTIVIDQQVPAVPAAPPEQQGVGESSYKVVLGASYGKAARKHSFADCSDLKGRETRDLFTWEEKSLCKRCAKKAKKSEVEQA